MDPPLVFVTRPGALTIRISAVRPAGRPPRPRYASRSDRRSASCCGSLPGNRWSCERVARSASRSTTTSRPCGRRPSVSRSGWRPVPRRPTRPWSAPYGSSPQPSTRRCTGRSRRRRHRRSTVPSARSRARPSFEAVDRHGGRALRRRGPSGTACGAHRRGRDRRHVGDREPADEARRPSPPPRRRRGGRAAGAAGRDADLGVVPVGSFRVGGSLRLVRLPGGAGPRPAPRRGRRRGRILPRALGGSLPGRRRGGRGRRVVGRRPRRLGRSQVRRASED